MVGTVFNKFSMRLIDACIRDMPTGGSSVFDESPALCPALHSSASGFGRGGVAVVPCGLLMNNWFKEKRGLVTGIALAGSTQADLCSYA